MDKLKPAVIAGIAGLGFSLLVALASGVRFPALLIRPLAFGGIFFGLGVAALYLYRRYLVSPGEYDGLGRNVDISLDDDEKMIIGEDSDGMNLTGFEETGGSLDSDAFSEDESAAGSELSQNMQGLEQNSALGYTEKGYGLGESFKPMDFNILSQNTDQEPSRPVASMSAKGQNVYARMPEMESVVNADPKKLARTVENLLSDE
ncbi:MAG: hypothetical protein LBL31_02760 [Spirochaetaceae bacterium]|nr:hypothetical protein [Spirochaetaceae bacterium]